MAAPVRLVQRANALVFGVLVTILLTIGGLTWDRFNAAYTAREWTDRSYQVLRALKDMRIAIAETESSVRGFSLSGDDADLAGYRESLGQIAYLQSEIHQLIADNPDQVQRFDQLAPILQRHIDQLTKTVEIRRSGGTAGAESVLHETHAKSVLSQVLAVSGAMLDDERRLLTARLDLGDRRNRWLGWMILAGTLLSMLILMLAARMLNEAWARTSSVEGEQRDLAEQLRISLNSLSQGVGVFDADQKLLYWNHCFQHLLGLPKSLLGPGRPYADIAESARQTGDCHLESPDDLRYAVQVASDPVVIERQRGDGHLLELRRTGTPHSGFVLTVTDMTKRAEAESVLREAQKMQAIGQLTGGIAHDFNNLLQVILGNLEFAKSKISGDERLTQRIERATWAAQRGASLTAQLLAFARRQALDPAPFDLGQSLPALVPLLQRTLGPQIDVRYQEFEGLWPAMADAAQTESAVLNLALNARDAMPGGGRLTIAVANTTLADEGRPIESADGHDLGHPTGPAPGDYVMITVTDTGHGMTPEVLARVFEPFFTTKAEGKGTGLGLAMVFGFARQANGHVAITSEPGRGSCVRLYLPRATKAGAVVTDEREGAPLPRGRADILLVEDDPNVREVAGVILRDLGYHIIEASDGDEALALFMRHADSIDLVLTDLILPGRLDGRELAREIVAAKPDLPVVLMSGSADDPGDGIESLTRLTKPFTRKELAQVVSQILERYALTSGTASVKIVALPKR
jgi:signal transduction histidine kinase/CHASE3 domain sensor protein/CheY-like chemotaxis protein